MTRKHFIAIAETLNSVKPKIAHKQSIKYKTWMETVEALADTCRRYNGMFDRERFIAACKGE